MSNEIYRPRPGVPEGFVYAFAAGAHVKIGLSQFDPNARWWQIRSHNPLLEPALYITQPLGKSARKVERAAHKVLASCRVTGEWFTCPRDEAVEVIKKLEAEARHG